MIPRPLRRPLVLALLCTSLLAAPGCGDSADPASDDVLASDPMAGTFAATGSGPRRLSIPDGAPKVIFLGDSIATGLHLPEHQAFPAVLQRLLADEGLPFRLVNAGVSGDTSRGGTSRLSWLLRQHPDLLVLELGGNDGLRGLPLVALEDNLRSIITRCREADVAVLLLGIEIPANYGEYAQGLSAIYPRLAAEYELPFVPFFMEGVAGHPGYNLPDQLHPNAQGHELMARRVLPTLREAVALQSRSSRP